MQPLTQRLFSGYLIAQRGLSRKEFLLVVLILAAIALFFVNTYGQRLAEAKQHKARQDLNRINQALQQYKLDNQHYPYQAAGLESLLQPSELDRQSWNGPYLKRAKLLLDPWGRPYQYRLADNGLSVSVSSLGADGEQGGSGSAADIVLVLRTPL